MTPEDTVTPEGSATPKGNVTPEGTATPGHPATPEDTATAETARQPQPEPEPEPEPRTPEHELATPEHEPATDSDAGTAEQPPPETTPWQRLHPLTPVLRGGRYVALIVLAVGQQQLRQSPGRALLVGFAVGVPLAMLLGYLSWRAMRYRITATELQIDSGILTKRNRRVPLARLQAVDVVQPFYGRVLGVSEVRLEVVGGGNDSEAPLAFLGEDDAAQVRAQLLDRAAGRSAAVGGATSERVLVTVPTGVLVRSTLLSTSAVVVVLALVALLIAVAIDVRIAGGMLLFAVPALLGAATGVAKQLLSGYGFTVAESADGLRLRHGLLDKRSQTIPPGRVQTIRVREPLLWRRFGWVAVDVDIAGYGAGQEAATGGTLLPVAPRELAERLVARVLQTQLPAADAVVPTNARLLAPLSRRRLKVGLSATHLVSTRGVVTTTTDIAPLAKLQSMRVTQGPLQRRLHLATVHADTAGRRLTGVRAEHRAAGEAHELLQLLDERARLARVQVSPSPAPP